MKEYCQSVSQGTVTSLCRLFVTVTNSQQYTNSHNEKILNKTVSPAKESN